MQADSKCFSDRDGERKGGTDKIAARGEMQEERRDREKQRVSVATFVSDRHKAGSLPAESDTAVGYPQSTASSIRVTPGALDKSSRAAAADNGALVCMCTASECP